MTDPSFVTVRGTILERAKELIEGDRNQTYGDPVEGMACFAGLVDTYITHAFATRESDMDLTAVDGAAIMCLLKLSRIATNPKHADNYLDLAGYAAIAGECSLPEGMKGEI